MEMSWRPNFVEKLIEAHETNDFSYNSGIAVEFDVMIETERMKSSFLKVLKKYPKLCYSYKDNKPIFDLDHLFTLKTGSSLNDFTEKLSINEGKGVRLVIDAELHRIKFYVHHSLVDGICHSYLLKELLNFYVGNEIEISLNREGLQSGNYSRIQFFRRFLDPNFRRVLLNLSKRYDCFTLVQPNSISRQKYMSKNLVIEKKQLENLKQYSRKLKVSNFNLILEVACQALVKTEPDIRKDIVIACPINLRGVIKNNAYFGNMVGLTRFSISLKDVKEQRSLYSIKKELKNLISKKYFSLMFEVLNYISLFLSKKKLKKIFSKKTMNSTDINSTFMASYMKVDSGTFPPQMKLKNASLLSSLFKSPGMGFVIVEMEV